MRRRRPGPGPSRQPKRAVEAGGPTEAPSKGDNIGTYSIYIYTCVDIDISLSLSIYICKHIYVTIYICENLYVYLHICK